MNNKDRDKLYRLARTIGSQAFMLEEGPQLGFIKEGTDEFVPYSINGLIQRLKTLEEMLDNTKELL